MHSWTKGLDPSQGGPYHPRWAWSTCCRMPLELHNPRVMCCCYLLIEGILTLVPSGRSRLRRHLVGFLFGCACIASSWKLNSLPSLWYVLLQYLHHLVKLARSYWFRYVYVADVKKGTSTQYGPHWFTLLQVLNVAFSYNMTIVFSPLFMSRWATPTWECNEVSFIEALLLEECDQRFDVAERRRNAVIYKLQICTLWVPPS